MKDVRKPLAGTRDPRLPLRLACRKPPAHKVEIPGGIPVAFLRENGNDLPEALQLKPREGFIFTRDKPELVSRPEGPLLLVCRIPQNAKRVYRSTVLALQRRPKRLKVLKQALCRRFLPHGGRQLPGHRIGEKGNETHLLIERCTLHLRSCRSRPREDLRDLIDVPVTVPELIVDEEARRDLRILQVGADKSLRHGLPELLIDGKSPRQVLPGTGRHEMPPVRLIFHRIKMIRMNREIRCHRRVDAPLCRILRKCLKVLQNVQPLHAVQRHDVEIPDRTVVFRRIARAHEHKRVRQLVGAERLHLQELQHGRDQGLRDAVDLVEE